MHHVQGLHFIHTRTYSYNFLRGYIQGVRSNIMYTCAWAKYYDLCFRLSTRKHTSDSTKIVCKFVLERRTTTSDFASVLETAPQKSQANSDIINNFCNRNTNLFFICAATQKLLANIDIFRYF